METKMRGRWSFPVAMIIAVGVAIPVGAMVPPDDGIEQRRKTAITQLASDFEPQQRDYHTEYEDVSDVPASKKSNYRSDCWLLSRDSRRLLAALEADRRGYGGGISPDEAEPIAGHIAESLSTLVGTEADPNRCNFRQHGSTVAAGALLPLALMAKNYADQWSQETRESLLAAARSEGYVNGGDDDSHYRYFKSTYTKPIAADLLVGESLGDPDLFDRGMDRLNRMVDHVMTWGPIEMNSPEYRPLIFSSLHVMQETDDPEAHAKARLLLDYLFLFQAHTYLPRGGAIGAPQERDYEGGAVDDLQRFQSVYWLTLGHPSDNPLDEPTGRAIMLMTDYQVPRIIRSIFFDKGDGYTFRANTTATYSSRYPDSRYESKTWSGDQWISPWKVEMLPDGDASIGITYGYRNRPLYVSNGVYVRDDSNDRYHILYQYAPWVDLRPYRENGETVTPPVPAGCECPPDRSNCEDTYDTGTPHHGTPSANHLADDFTTGLYDYERLLHDRTLIQLWDPTTRDKSDDVRRICQDTRVHLPDFEAAGHSYVERDGWRVAKVDDVYVGFRPLGEIAAEESRSEDPWPTGDIPDRYRTGGDGQWTYMRLDGVSGSIVELATDSQFDSVDAYARDLASRDIRFSSSDRVVEFEARDVDSGERVPVKLEYRTDEDRERRTVDGSERGRETLDFGLMDSPWVDWNPDEQRLTVQRGCYQGLSYRWGTSANASVEQIPPSEDCHRFSEIDHFGDIRNYQFGDADRWRVEALDGNRRLVMPDSDVAQTDGDALGAFAVARERTYETFDMRLRARNNEPVSENDMADYALVFGWQNPDEYYYLMANADERYSALYRVEEGERRRIAHTDRALVSDTDWHELHLQRRRNQVRVRFDDSEVLRTELPAPDPGRAGVGTFNDTAAFDDIDVTRHSTMDENTGEMADRPDVADQMAAPPQDGRDALESDAASSIDPPGEDDLHCSCSNTGSETGRHWLVVLVALGVIAAVRRLGRRADP